MAWSIADFQAFLHQRPAAAMTILPALLRKMGQRLRQASEGIHTLLRALEGSPV